MKTTKPLGFFDYPRPSVAVDLVVFTMLDADLKVLLVRRGEAPQKGEHALPGGFVRVGMTPTDQGESVDAAAARELAEETGLPADKCYLEQLYTFGDAGRDTRGRVISVAYYALIRPTLAPLVRAGGDAEVAEWVSVSTLAPHTLAFDHGRILEVGLARIRGKLDYSDLAFALVPETFTIPELRSVHEVVKGRAYDKGNFRRRFQRMLADGVIAPAVGKRITGAKPAKVYRFCGPRQAAPDA